jgi:hypothetical protein
MAGEKFRRLAAPSASYVAPNGELWPFTDYEYINKNPSGGDRAPMDTNATGSVANNPGSFFVAFQDDASSSFANRPHWALAMNTDWLDELLHRPLATTTRLSATGTGVAEVPVTSGYVWTGDVDDPDPSDFVKLTLRASGVLDWDSTWMDGGVRKVNKCIDIMKGGVSVLGTGMVSASVPSPVTFVFQSAVTTGRDVHVYYAGRDSIGTMPPGNLVRHVVQPSVLTGTVWHILDLIRGDGEDPNAVVAISLQGAADEVANLHAAIQQYGLDDAYRRQETGSGVPDTFYPSRLTTGIAGVGGWILRDGIAPAVYSKRSTTQIYVDQVNACHKAYFRDAYGGLAQGGSNGYVVYGARRSLAREAEAAYAPGFASFLALQEHTHPATESGLPFTYIPVGTAATLSNGVITITPGGSGARFWKTDISDMNRSAIAVNVDLIEFTDTATGKLYTFLIGALDPADATKVTVKHLNGTVVQTSFSMTGTVRLHHVTFGVSDGALEQGLSSEEGGFKGLFYSSGAPNPDPAEDEMNPQYYRGAPARFFGSGLSATESVLLWGQFDSNISSASQPGYVRMGRLTAGGHVDAQDVNVSGSLSVTNTAAVNKLYGTTVSKAPGVVSTSPSVSYTANVTDIRHITLDTPVPDTGTSVFPIALNYLKNGMEIALAISRTSNAVTSITFTCKDSPSGGTLPTYVDAGDLFLTPWVSGTVLDLYTIKMLGGRVFISVQRF